MRATQNGVLVPDTLERAEMLALLTAARGSWHRWSPVFECHGSARAILLLDDPLVSPARFTLPLDEILDDSRVGELAVLLESQASVDTHLVTVLDDGYPNGLRSVDKRPPILWVRGNVAAAARVDAVAVVGSRGASPRGLEATRVLAEKLASDGLCVLSGLAQGVDTAAHTGALSAHGTTVAVMGTGVDRVYPTENAALANQICEAGGALVSQFMPSTPPARWTFPMRNAVMSGMSLGSVIVEASESSGAKIQADLAAEQGKCLMLWQPLVESESWAQELVTAGVAVAVASSDDVHAALRHGPPETKGQMSLY